MGRPHTLSPDVPSLRPCQDASLQLLPAGGLVWTPQDTVQPWWWAARKTDVQRAVNDPSIPGCLKGWPQIPRVHKGDTGTGPQGVLIALKSEIDPPGGEEGLLTPTLHSEPPRPSLPSWRSALPICPVLARPRGRQSCARWAPSALTMLTPVCPACRQHPIGCPDFLVPPTKQWHVPPAMECGPQGPGPRKPPTRSVLSACSMELQTDKAWGLAGPQTEGPGTQVIV